MTGVWAVAHAASSIITASANLNSRGAFFGGAEGQEERHRATCERAESLQTIEGDGVFVFRIDNNREGFHIAFENAKRRVGEQNATEPLSMEVLIDGKTPDERRR